MLNPKDNELLTQTGRGTPMGTLLREYWWPVLRADKVLADGAPERVRLLGEDLVVFRDTKGRLGALDEHCPHRRVSLALARNEECGLRCIMHGWKINTEGKVVDTPNEAVGGARLERIRVRHFPVREAGGMVWIYLDQKKEPPQLPNMPFVNAVDIEPLLCKINCNWIQVMETLWDPAHVLILHAQDASFFRLHKGMQSDKFRSSSLAVSNCRIREEEWGFRYRFDGGMGNWWVPTVMPCWIFVNGRQKKEDDDLQVFCHTPVDDEHMLLWQVPYNLKKKLGPLGELFVKPLGEGKHNFRLPTMIPEENWGQDRESMKNDSFTGLAADKGIAGVLNQDVAVAESMGPISDRSVEHLGPADHALIKGRYMMLDALRRYRDTGEVMGLHSDLSGIGRFDDHLFEGSEDVAAQ